MLKVTPIRANSVEYAKIHNKISKYIKGNNEYSIGYEIGLYVAGQKVEVDNKLYLSVPNVKNITGVYFLSGNSVNKTIYDTESGNIIIDLSENNINLNTIFITQKRILLKAWQIILIVVLIVLVIVAIILTIIIIRKRKITRTSIHEKI